MGDVIDINGRLKAQIGETTSGPESASVVDITQMRADVLREDSRKVKRTILTEFIAVHTVVPGRGLMKVALYDINNGGLAFDMDVNKGHFQVGEEVAMRVYLNHKTYFSFIIKIKHIHDVKDEEVHRHGAEFVKGTINDVALHHFVSFIENVCAGLKHDNGDVLVSNINS